MSVLGSIAAVSVTMSPLEFTTLRDDDFSPEHKGIRVSTSGRRVDMIDCLTFVCNSYGGARVMKAKKFDTHAPDVVWSGSVPARKRVTCTLQEMLVGLERVTVKKARVLADKLRPLAAATLEQHPTAPSTSPTPTLAVVVAHPVVASAPSPRAQEGSPSSPVELAPAVAVVVTDPDPDPVVASAATPASDAELAQHDAPTKPQQLLRCAWVLEAGLVGHLKQKKVFDHAGDAHWRAIRSWCKTDEARAWFVAAGLHPDSVQVDHVVPRNMGGVSHVYNACFLPGSKNAAFGDRLDAAKKAYVGASAVAVASAVTRWHTAAASKGVNFATFDPHALQ